MEESKRISPQTERNKLWQAKNKKYNQYLNTRIRARSFIRKTARRSDILLLQEAINEALAVPIVEISLENFIEAEKQLQNTSPQRWTLTYEHTDFSLSELEAGIGDKLSIQAFDKTAGTVKKMLFQVIQIRKVPVDEERYDFEFDLELISET
jgi:hypothetical protein